VVEGVGQVNRLGDEAVEKKGGVLPAAGDLRQQGVDAVGLGAGGREVAAMVVRGERPAGEGEVEPVEGRTLFRRQPVAQWLDDLVPQPFGDPQTDLQSPLTVDQLLQPGNELAQVRVA
jgi:hypothetical protein